MRHWGPHVVPLHEDLTFMQSDVSEPVFASAGTDAESEEIPAAEPLVDALEPLVVQAEMETDATELPRDGEEISPIIAGLDDGQEPNPQAVGAVSAPVVAEADVLDFADIDALSIEEKLALFS
ncbi:hypothetical protein AEGHOMDF_6008 [Methylobacterium soli]|nr:hypothetical protein AEGHOMDF_6008 [Methylobacterium soli]